MIFSQLIKEQTPIKLTRIQRIERTKNIFKANIGKKIMINHYMRYETTSVNYQTIGIIDALYGLQDVIIQTEDRREIIDINKIIGYTL